MKNFYFTLLLSLVVSNAFAADVHLLTSSTSADSAIAQEMEKLQGPINTDTVEPALSSENNFEFLVIESKDYAQDMNSLTKNTLASANALLITGQPEQNALIAQYLLGYSVAADYLLIKGLKTDQGPKLVYFNNEKDLSLDNVARSIVKSALK